MRSFTPGSELGDNYQITETLGSGAVGTVYKALNRRSGEDVALKLLHGSTGSEEEMRRFEREFHVLSRIDHGRVVPTLEYGFHEGRPFYTMEYVQGATLSEVLQSPEGEKLSQAWAFPVLIEQICAGLGHIHSQGVIHRDLKPSNIVLGERFQDGQLDIRLLDFGLVKLLGRSALDITQTGGIVGSVEYISPEQARGGWVDERSDLYSLGAILYEVLTGSPPFQVDNTLAVVMKLLREVPVPPSELSPVVGPAADRLVLRLLEKEPIDRYATAADVAADVGPLGREQKLVSTFEEPVKRESSLRRLLRPRFLGREDELKTLRLMLAHAQAGIPQAVLVSGEAGIGKTRLLQEIAGDARVQGFRVLTGQCLEQGGLPAEPFRTVLGRLPDLSDSSYMDTKSAQNDGHSLSPDSGPNLHALCESIWSRIQDALNRRPILLLLEDVQWIDDVSQRLVSYCLNCSRDDRLLICLTCRSTLSTDVPGGLERLVRRPASVEVGRIHLKALGEPEAAAMAASMLGERSVPNELASYLHKEAGGHPLFTVEMLRALFEAGRLARGASSVWSVDASTPLPAPRDVMAVLRERTSNLAAPHRRALDYASVLKGVFRFPLLLRIWRGSDLELMEILEELEEEGILQSDGMVGDSYRFSHALMQRAVYEELGETKREILHREAGRAFEESRDVEDPDVVDHLAFHYSSSGDHRLACRYLAAAAKNALRAADPTQAVRHSEKAIRLGTSNLVDHLGGREEHHDFACNYSDALLKSDRAEEALKQADILLAEALSTAPRLRATALMNRARALATLRRPKESEETLLDALSTSRDLGDGQGQRAAAVALATSYASMGRAKEASQYCRLAAESYRTHPQPNRPAADLFYESYALFWEGRIDEAIRVVERALGCCPERSEPRRKCQRLLGELALQAGCHELGLEALGEIKGVQGRRGVFSGEAVVVALMLELAMDAGRRDAVHPHIHDLANLVSLLTDTHLVHRYCALLARASAYLGNVSEAQSWAERAEPGTHLPGITSSIVWRGIAAAHEADGETEEAAEAHTQAAEAGHRLGGFEGGRALLDAGRFSLRQGEYTNAEVLAVEAELRLRESGSTQYAREAERLVAEAQRRTVESKTGTEESFDGSQVRLSMFYNIADALFIESGLPAFLNATLDHLVAGTGAEKAAVALMGEDPETSTAEVVASYDLDNASVEAITAYIIQNVVDTGELWVSRDIQSDERICSQRAITDLGIRGLMCIPLTHPHTDRIGAIYLDRRARKEAFSEEDREFLFALGRVISSAIVTARQHVELEERATLPQQQVEERHRLGDLIGKSRAMQETYGLIERSSKSDVAVLIRGETGTGKELGARAVHNNSRRKDKPFVPQNCAAISPDLLESELFGHANGAFTGARADRAGLFEEADGGTIFLDEIGEASPRVQSSLLRVLQDGEIRRVGESRSRKVDVRVIAATNRDLEAHVEEGGFRRDLYYRLRVMEFEMPPLRERLEDIPMLAAHLAERAAIDEGKSIRGITLESIKHLLVRQWPGNVRELENELRRAVAMVEDGAELTPDVFTGREPLLARDASQTSPTTTLRSCMDTVEKEIIAWTMASCGDNVSEAARRLGVSRQGLYKKLQRHDQRA